MPVIAGIKEAEGRIRVQSIWYQIDQHPNGYSIERDKIPPFPAPKVGISHIMFLNPEKKEIWFEEQERPLFPEEMEVEEAKEKFREEGREEIRKIVREAAELPDLAKEARRMLKEEGILGNG